VGTASRIVGGRTEDGWTVGALVVSNFGRPEDLVICGTPIGALIPAPVGERGFHEQPRGSIVTVIATDALLDSRQLGRLARRVQSGLARVGGYAEHGSGEFVVAFSANPAAEMHIRDGAVMDNELEINGLFRAVTEVTEEAVINSLFTARTTRGRDGRIGHELPVEAVIRLISPTA
jgi:D-aminopeptidase